MDLSSDPFTGSSTEEIGSEDDLFTTYIDVDKLGASGSAASQPSDDFNVAIGLSVDGDHRIPTNNNSSDARPRHRYSNSVDAATSSASGAFGEIMDAKKAMPPDKLAELWTIDPKRAKRFVFSCFFFIFLSPRIFLKILS